MPTDAPDGRADPIDAIFKSLDNSEWGRRNLPRLVSLLTHDRARVRMGAGWAITYVAQAHSDSATYLLRRLGDRMTDEDVPLAVEQAFLGVAARYPEAVEVELGKLLDSDDGPRVFQVGVGGSMLRAEYAMGGDRDRDVGRVRFPKGGEPGEGQVFTSDERKDQWRLDLDGRDDEDDAAGSEGRDDADAARSDDGGRPSGRPARELWAGTDVLAVITAKCRFDDLAVMSQRHRGRYGDLYRMRADIEDEELPVELALFHRPETDSSAARTAFVEDLETALGRWQRVDDVDGVRSLYDWGRTPRPWGLVEYADTTLRKRERLSTDEALWNARHLATSLSHLHENGVVHAGLDPTSVRYRENLLDVEERQIPMVTSVALLSVLREYFDPTTRLDPRYAAPEYFDRRFGRIDAASDIYGLGALCYHLVTGRPPYAGSYSAVRDAVLSPEPPRPSDVADVPAGIDDVVGKAMAAEKLHRYEGVTHLAGDLRAIANREGIAALDERRARGTADSTGTDASAGRNTDSSDGEAGGPGDEGRDDSAGVDRADAPRDFAARTDSAAVESGGTNDDGESTTSEQSSTSTHENSDEEDP